MDKNKLEKIKKLLEILKANNSPVKIEKIKELLQLVNSNLTREEFLDAFKKVMNHTLRVEIKAIEKVNKAIGDLKAGNNASLQATQADLRVLSVKLEKVVGNALKEQENALNFIRDKVRKLKNGYTPIKGVDYFDGKPADEKKITKKVLEQIPEIDQIDNLKKEIEDLKKRPSRGGGTSAMGVAQAFKWILKTEAPVGLINGINTEYTVKHTIFAVLAFSLSGEVICQIPNYTIAGNKITFSTALPSAYSGRDFEIKYI